MGPLKVQPVRPQEVRRKPGLEHEGRMLLEEPSPLMGPDLGPDALKPFEHADQDGHRAPGILTDLVETGVNESAEGHHVGHDPQVALVIEPVAPREGSVGESAEE